MHTLDGCDDMGENERALGFKNLKMLSSVLGASGDVWGQILQPLSNAAPKMCSPPFSAVLLLKVKLKLYNLVSQSMST